MLLLEKGMVLEVLLTSGRGRKLNICRGENLTEVIDGGEAVGHFEFIPFRHFSQY